MGISLQRWASKGCKKCFGGTVSPFKNGENFQIAHAFLGGKFNSLYRYN